MGETPLEGLSREELEQRLAHALLVGDDATAGDVETRLAGALLDAGELDPARRHADRAVALQRRAGVGEGLARALAVLGHASRAGGDADAATGAFLEAIDLEGRYGHRDVVASLLGALGDLAATAGDRGRARDLLAAALRTAPESREDAARRAELGLARMELEDGDDASAARRALRVLQGGARGEVALEAATLLAGTGTAALHRQDAEAARRRYELALRVIRRQGTAEALASVLGGLGAACRTSGDLSAARGFWEEAVAQARELSDRAAAVELQAGLLHDLGEMALAEQRDPQAALGFLEGALVASEAAGTLRRSVALAGRLHEAARAAGDARAAERWRLAVGRAAFAANVARLAEGLLAQTAVPPLETAVLGDTGTEPRTVRIPGRRVSDGVLWRRRLAAEVRRAAPLRRVAVLRGGMQARPDGGVRPLDAPLREAVWMFVVEHESVEVRVAGVERGGEAPVCGPWLAADEPGWPGSRDGLVEALRAALD